MWSCIEWLGEDSHYFNLSAVVPVPEACLIDDVTKAVALVVGRHEALRTKFIFRDGEPRQDVSADGTLSLRVLSIDQPGQPGGSTLREAIDFLIVALRSLPFDHAAECWRPRRPRFADPR